MADHAFARAESGQDQAVDATCGAVIFLTYFPTRMGLISIGRVIRLAGCWCAMFLMVLAAHANVDEFTAGYVVNSQKDTVRGFVRLRGHEFDVKNCVFKKTLLDPVVQYSPGDIIAYGGGSKYFRSFRRITNDGEQLFFIQNIFQGKVNLYYYGSDAFFIESQGVIEELLETKKEVFQDGRTFVIRQRLFLATLENAMQDCPTMHKQISMTIIQRKSLLTLLKKYHECIGVVIQEPTREEEGSLQVRMGLSIGATSTNLRWQDSDDPRYVFFGRPTSSQISPSAGFWVEIWNPSVSTRFRLRTGLDLLLSNSSQSNARTLAGLKYDFTLATARLQVPVQMKYFIGRHLYLQGGAAVGTFLSFDDDLRISAYPTGGFVQQEKGLNPAAVVVFLNGGLGYEWRMNNRAFFVEADFKQNLIDISQGAAQNTPAIQFTTYGLNLGIALKKDL